ALSGRRRIDQNLQARSRRAAGGARLHSNRKFFWRSRAPGWATAFRDGVSGGTDRARRGKRRNLPAHSGTRPQPSAHEFPALDYARGSTQLNKHLVSVWGMLDELNQQSLRLLPGKNIHFVKHIRYDGNLEIDRARFVRMLSSLIKNAREAMVGGGILTITTDL